MRRPELLIAGRGGSETLFATLTKRCCVYIQRPQPLWAAGFGSWEGLIGVIHT